MKPRTYLSMVRYNAACRSAAAWARSGKVKLVLWCAQVDREPVPAAYQVALSIFILTALVVVGILAFH